MKTDTALYFSQIEGLPLISRGKVRDIYRVGDDLAIVATDRISCFDVVLPTPIPGKGATLTALTCHWFATLLSARPHHLITADLAAMPAPLCDLPALAGRTMLVERCAVLPVECIVRGYLAGSAVAEYQAHGTVCGIALPAGLRPFSKLPQPIFTPSTKAVQGEKDENISFEQMVALIGRERAESVRERSLAIYAEACTWSEPRGVIIADTKFEWGVREGELVLIDEVLTPDSSRFWPVSDYRPGESATSLDKQVVRDYLLASGWNKLPPAPALPDEIVAIAAARYRQVLDLLTGGRCDGA
jgi:phosphoribosylaminoimidazole-succinocarboxamide synthase